MYKKVFLIIILSLSFFVGVFSVEEAKALISCRCQLVLPAVSPDPRNMCTDDLDYTDCSELVTRTQANDPTVTISCVTLATEYCNGRAREGSAAASGAAASTESAQGVKSTGCVPGGQENNGQEVCKLTNPIGSGQTGTTEVSVIIAKVISTLLGIIGGLTLLMFVWGGFQWLTSAGSPEKVKNGMQTMVWAVIGVMLVLASYLLLSTFLNFLTGKAT